MVFPAPLLFGAAQFANNALGAFGQQQQAEEEHRYSEKVRRQQHANSIRDYNYRVQQSQRDWKQALAIRQAEVKQYKSQLKENEYEANRAMFRNNRQLAEIQDRAKSQALDSYIQVLEANAMGTAGGGTGRRAQMGQRANLAALGRQMSLRGDALVRHQEETQFRNEEVQRARGVADRNAWFPVSVPMQRPIGPARPSPFISRRAPSRTGMYTSMIGSAFGAVQTIGQLNPGGFLGFGVQPGQAANASTGSGSSG